MKIDSVRRGLREPEEFRTSFIATPRTDRPIFDGTDVLVIGTHVRRLPSGLLVPGPPPAQKQPIDAIATFITAMDLIGRRVTLDEFNAAITSASREALIKAFAQLLALVETASVFDRNAQRAAAEQYLQGAVLNRALGAIDEGRILLAPQVLLVAMKTALVLAPEIGAEPAPTAAVFTVLFFLVDLLGGPEEDTEPKWRGYPRDVSLEVIRNQHFNRSVRLSGLMARYWRIWHELPVALGASDGDAPVDHFKAETGCLPEELMLFGLWCWASAQKGLVLLPPELIAAIPISEDAKKACLELMASPVAELRVKAGEQSVKDGIPWTFLAFRERPLCRLADGSVVILSPRFVVERAFGGAMFWVLNDRANRLDGGTSKNGLIWQAFRNAHADCIEAYAEEVLASWCLSEDAGQPKRVFDEDDMTHAWGNGVAVSDIALDYGWAFVCLEINSRRFGQGAAVGAGAEEIDRELRLMIEEKAGRQLQSTVARLRADPSALTGRPGTATRIFPVMFVAYGFPTNPLTLEAIREKLKLDGLLQGEDVAPLELLDLDEVDLLDAVREQTGETLVQILRDKHVGGFFRTSITDHLLLEKAVNVQDSRRTEGLFRVAHRAALSSSNDPAIVERMAGHKAD